jgi:hypothetical protein
VGIRGRFADRRLSVFMIEGALPRTHTLPRDKFFARRPLFRPRLTLTTGRRSSAHRDAAFAQDGGEPRIGKLKRC